MEKMKVVLVELPLFKEITPLVSGYLQASALLSPVVRERFEFCVRTVVVSDRNAVDTLLELEADIVAISTYVWNAKVVRKFIERLATSRPDMRIILGGPQVMHQAESYLRDSMPNLVICNGEGEVTFRQYLEAIAEPGRGLESVGGLSFRDGGRIVTTSPNERLTALEVIPSPYLDGLVELNDQSFAILETNRGCPFKCSYCYWGAATNSKVHKFPKDRVLDEITTLARSRVSAVFIVDANFGMLGRDIEIAQHIANCHDSFGFPSSVYFCSSKNTPERVSEIIQIWAKSGVMSSQPVSLQTMSETALAAVERSNIKHETYATLQQTLDDLNMESYIELIWPLPGESLQSFADGIDRLCEANSNSILGYPLMLLNNIPLLDRAEEFGFSTVPEQSDTSDALYVVSTGTVSREDYQEGIEILWGLCLLFTFNGLRNLSHYLHAERGVSYSALFLGFIRFLDAHEDSSALGTYLGLVRKSPFYNSGVGGFAILGALVHKAFHEHKHEFQTLLLEFLSANGWMEDDTARTLFEMDYLLQPKLYANSERDLEAIFLKNFRIAERDGDKLRIQYSGNPTIAESHPKLNSIWNSGTKGIAIDYGKGDHIPFDAKFGADFYYGLWSRKMRGEVRSVTPAWNPI